MKWRGVVGAETEMRRERRERGHEEEGGESGEVGS